MKKLKLVGETNVPSDKSISHRAILFSLLSKGKSTINLVEPGRDNLASLRIISQLGAKVFFSGPQVSAARAMEEGIDNVSFELETEETFLSSKIEIEGVGADNFTKPVKPLDCGNSGTTARLLTGILSGSNIEAEIVGDSSLSKRPFKRVRVPLEEMGANFSADFLPLSIKGKPLSGIEYISPVASAQVKSAILLAGLSAKGASTVIEPHPSRDHTEHMLRAMGASVSGDFTEKGEWRVELKEQEKSLSPLINYVVPGDLSSGAFLIVAALLIPDSKITLKNCGVSSTRLGLINILKKMGASIELLNQRNSFGEELADIEVSYSELSGVEVERSEVIEAIDEIPILAVAAAFANGETKVTEASELRVKESDRIKCMCSLLKASGAKVDELEQGFIIHGGHSPKTGQSVFLDSKSENKSWQNTHDHRIEMSASVLELVLTSRMQVSEIEVVETSFPRFTEYFQELMTDT